LAIKEVVPENTKNHNGNFIHRSEVVSGTFSTFPND